VEGQFVWGREVILLDSHALIWALASPERLGKQLKRRLESAGWVYFSPISTFELNMAFMSGRAPKLPEDFQHRSSELAFTELQFSQEASECAKNFTALVKTDPFDWMLVAQAQSAGCDFYTADLRLLGLGLPFIKDATV
jgi:PIN domain nuclease of toxin-antitoxin system